MSRFHTALALLAACLFFLPFIAPSAAAAAETLYVAKADSTGTQGNGSQGNPFLGIEQALAGANDGDVLVLTEDVQHRETASGKGFTFNKAVTVQGKSHTLTFRGTDVYFNANVAFSDLTLNIVPDGAAQPSLWAQGNDLTFNNVSTDFGIAQKDLRPAIYSGDKAGASTGTATITITGGTSETRFAEIVAGNATGTSTLNTAIVIDSQFARADRGITSHTSGTVNVTSNSKNIKKFTGKADNARESVTFTGLTTYNVELANIDNLSLTGNSNITLATTFDSVPGTLTVESGSTLYLTNVATVSAGSLDGTGTVVIGKDATLNVDTVNAATKIAAQAWNDGEKDAFLTREFFSAATVNAEPTVVVTLNDEETPVARNSAGKWIGAATPDPTPDPTDPVDPTPDPTDPVEAIRFTAPADPVTVPEGKTVTAAYVYSLLTAPEGVTVGNVPSLPNSKANTISLNGQYRGYLYVDSNKLPADDAYGRFKIVVSVVDEVAGETTYPTVTLLKEKPANPDTNPNPTPKPAKLELSQGEMQLPSTGVSLWVILAAATTSIALGALMAFINRPYIKKQEVLA